MKFFSDCSDECKYCVIHYSGGCLAGHGDDDFIRVDETQINHILRFANDRSIKEFCNVFPEYERLIKLNKINKNIKS